jgi:hypothetical protein
MWVIAYSTALKLCSRRHFTMPVGFPPSTTRDLVDARPQQPCGSLPLSARHSPAALSCPLSHAACVGGAHLRFRRQGQSTALLCSTKRWSHPSSTASENRKSPVVSERRPLTYQHSTTRCNDTVFPQPRLPRFCCRYCILPQLLAVYRDSNAHGESQPSLPRRLVFPRPRGWSMRGIVS